MNSSNYITPFWIQNVTSSTINVTIIKNNMSAPTIDVYYSNDLSTWSLLGQTSTTALTLNVAAGNKVYFRSNADQWADTSSNYYYNHFSSTGNCNIGGNIMSLLYGSSFTGHEKVFPNENCYGIFNGLFVGWTNLIDAGELVLPVTHVESRSGAMGGACYRAMFNSCSNLINGPHVDLRFRDNPENDELRLCMQRFITGCPKIETIHINTQDLNGAFTDIFLSTNYNGLTWYDYSGNPLTSWPTNVTCVNVTSMYLPTYDRVVDWHSNYSGYVNQVNDNQNKIIYKKLDNKHTPFYVTNITSSPVSINVFKRSNRYSSGSYTGADTAPTITIEYSKDGTTWKTWCTTSSSEVHSMFIPPYTTYYFRASTSRWAIHFYWGSSHIETVAFNNISFGGTQSVELGGNIMSLLYGSSFTGNETSFPDNQYTYTFAYLFSMSRDGETYNAITHARNLIMPATTMTEAAYTWMFCGNISLVSTPNLPATSLADSCYECMFYGCTSLTCVSALPATTLAQECYLCMFYGCTSLEIAPELKALTIPYYAEGDIPYYVGAYSGMFSGCTSLKYVKCLATSPVDGKGTKGWLNNASQTGTFVKNTGTTWVSGTAGIPEGWTVVEV